MVIEIRLQRWWLREVNINKFETHFSRKITCRFHNEQQHSNEIYADCWNWSSKLCVVNAENITEETTTIIASTTTEPATTTVEDTTTSNKPTSTLATTTPSTCQRDKAKCNRDMYRTATCSGNVESCKHRCTISILSSFSKLKISVKFEWVTSTGSVSCMWIWYFQ